MNPTKDYIVHEGKIGVPDPAFPFPPKPIKRKYDCSNICATGSRECECAKEDNQYDYAFDLALLHAAWFEDQDYFNCEFCNGAGEVSRDSDGVAREYYCRFCQGTGGDFGNYRGLGTSPIFYLFSVWGAD